MEKYILGIDEVGRGPLAGPLYIAGAICIYKNKNFFNNICDSKKMSKNKREMICQKLNKYCICKSFYMKPSSIDKFGIRQCMKNLIHRCIKYFNKNYNIQKILIDGRDNFAYKFDIPIQYIIKGDEKHKIISIASIYAKVKRDKYMQKISNKYTTYQFDKNKGYGTKYHINQIKKYGICDMHRKYYCKNFI